MSELRLVVPAAVAWLAVLAVLVQRGPWVGAAAVAASAVVLVWWSRSQALLSVLVALPAAVVAQLRVWRADQVELPGSFHATVTRPPQATESGFMFRVVADGYPAGELPVFIRGGQAPAVGFGDVVTVSGEAVASAQAAVGQWLFVAGDVVRVGEASGVRGWVAHVRASFRASVEAVQLPRLSGDGAGLTPAMVLGDTSLQSPEAQEMYVNTGLSHLSAVSGGNVAILTSAAVVLLSLLGAKPRVQAAGAIGALLVFATVVGLEPSVLRAMITGVVGLVAVMCSTRTPPLHALSIAVIGGLVWDSSLAGSFGFALSVAATAGIVALYPIIFVGLAPLKMPEILTRAVAVTLAAEVLTMPLVAAMAGHVSTVSVVANVLAAAVVAPVTILGMAAAVLSLLPGSLEVPLLYVILPLVEWIALVARTGAGMRGAVIAVPSGALGIAWVALACAWVLGLALLRRMRITLAAMAVLIIAPSLRLSNERPIDPATLTVYHATTIADVPNAPPGTQLIIVNDHTGPPAHRPTITQDGIPVHFPHRDGPVTYYQDGTQHATNGNF